MIQISSKEHIYVANRNSSLFCQGDCYLNVAFVVEFISSELYSSAVNILKV